MQVRRILKPQRSSLCHKVWVILLPPLTIARFIYVEKPATPYRVCFHNCIYVQSIVIPVFCLGVEVEKYDENLHEKVVEKVGGQKRYYFENLKISVPQIKLSVFTSNKLPLDLKVRQSTQRMCFPTRRWCILYVNCRRRCSFSSSGEEGENNHSRTFVEVFLTLSNVSGRRGHGSLLMWRQTDYFY